MERPRPGPFLRASLPGVGAGRGFWARGDRWVAHRGVVRQLRLDRSVPDRFAEIRRRAQAVLGVEPGAEPLRLYGGFSFRDDPTDAPQWDAFPRALFHLPRVEMEVTSDGARLRVRRILDEGEAPERAEAELREEATRMARRLDQAPEERPRGPELRGHPEETDRETWEAAVRETLGAIEEGALEKAVLARTLDVAADGAQDPVAVALALRDQHPGTHAFFFEPRPGAWLVGAGPETVVTLRRGDFHATAVAGSTRRGNDPEETRRLGEELLESAKDRAEQRMVVEDMVARLAPYIDSVRVQPEPHVLTLARIQHLETEMGAAAPDGVHVLELLRALHPTPAVCGLPRDAALALLAREEPFERGWYAGPVGWFEPHGEGYFVPALRCAVGSEDRWRLFAGAGIVAGSEPSAEWEETAIKFEPVLRALEAAGVRIDPVAAGSPR